MRPEHRGRQFCDALLGLCPLGHHRHYRINIAQKLSRGDVNHIPLSIMMHASSCRFPVLPRVIMGGRCIFIYKRRGNGRYRNTALHQTRIAASPNPAVAVAPSGNQRPRTRLLS